MASPNLSEIVTTTIQNRSGKLADNVTTNNALLNRLKKRGKIKTLSGGDVILQELEYAANGTVMNYSGYESLNITPQDVFTSASFDWKQKAVAVAMSGLEELQNSGKERQIDLLEARISNAERSMMNSVATDLYSDGTGDGGKQIGGLQLLVPDDPTTGTVGGINRATSSNTFWRSQVWDATSDGSATSATTVQGNMNGLYVKLVRGTDRPDLILADNVYYKYYLASLQTIQRVTSDEMAQAGFVSLKYMDADVVLDGGMGGGMPASHMYFLNTDYIFFKSHKDRNFVPIRGERFATNQDAFVRLIAWAGNMTVSNASLQGAYKE